MDEMSRMQIENTEGDGFIFQGKLIAMAEIGGIGETKTFSLFMTKDGEHAKKLYDDAGISYYVEF